MMFSMESTLPKFRRPEVKIVFTNNRSIQWTIINGTSCHFFFGICSFPPAFCHLLKSEYKSKKQHLMTKVQKTVMKQNKKWLKVLSKPMESYSSQQNWIVLIQILMLRFFWWTDSSLFLYCLSFFLLSKRCPSNAILIGQHVNHQVSRNKCHANNLLSIDSLSRNLYKSYFVVMNNTPWYQTFNKTVERETTRLDSRCVHQVDFVISTYCNF